MVLECISYGSQVISMYSRVLDVSGSQEEEEEEENEGVSEGLTHSKGVSLVELLLV